MEGSLLLKIITPLINNIIQQQQYFYSILLDSINTIIENLDKKVYKKHLDFNPVLYGFIGRYNVSVNGWDSKIPVTLCSGIVTPSL